MSLYRTCGYGNRINGGYNPFKMVNYNNLPMVSRHNPKLNYGVGSSYKIQNGYDRLPASSKLNNYSGINSALPYKGFTTPGSIADLANDSIRVGKNVSTDIGKKYLMSRDKTLPSYGGVQMEEVYEASRSKTQNSPIVMATINKMAAENSWFN